MSDTLSLIVFAICAGIYQSGFSVLNLGVQLIEIAIFVPLVLFGLSRLGALLLKKFENDENSHFVLMLAFMVVAGLLARIVNLPGIVGAFLPVWRLTPRFMTSRLRAHRSPGKFPLYPNFLYRDRLLNRSGRLHSRSD